MYRKVYSYQKEVKFGTKRVKMNIKDQTWESVQISVKKISAEKIAAQGVL